MPRIPWHWVYSGCCSQESQSSDAARAPVLVCAVGAEREKALLSCKGLNSVLQLSQGFHSAVAVVSRSAVNNKFSSVAFALLLHKNWEWEL